MSDTVESLRAELEALRAAFEEFRDYAKPIIDQHQPGPPIPGSTFMRPMPPGPLVRGPNTP